MLPIIGLSQSHELQIEVIEDSKNSKQVYFKNDFSSSPLYYFNARSLLNNLNQSLDSRVSLKKSLNVHSHIDMRSVSIVDDQTSLYGVDNIGTQILPFSSSDFTSYYGMNESQELVVSAYRNALPFGYLKNEDNVIDLDPVVSDVRNYINGNARSFGVDKRTILRGSCANRGLLSPIESTHDHEAERTKGINYKSGNEKIVDFTIVLDNAYVEKNGGSDNAIAKALGVVNAMHTNFDGEFDSDIIFKIKDIVISNCAKCDPWSDDKDIASLLLEVNDWTLTQQYLQTNDAVLFWTGRDINGDAIGSAYTSSLCSEVSTIVLQDFSDSPWELKVLASHEVGHSLSSSHDHQSSPTIMAPELTNSSNWSSSSINAVNAFIQSENCIASSAISSCTLLTDLTAVILNNNVLDLNWEATTEENCNVQIIDLNDQSIIYQVETSSSSIRISNVLMGCKDYRVVVEPICSGSTSSSLQAVITTQRESDVLITNVIPSTCYTSGEETLYDLNFTVSNSAPNIEAVASVGNVKIALTIFNGTHGYQVFGLTAADLLTELSISANDQIFPSCMFSYTFFSPGKDCAVDYNYSFNDCILPDGWSINSLGNTHEDFKWNIQGSNRSILNYGNGQNALTTKTIDGSCMILIDDDLINSSGHTGTTWLESPQYDLSTYDSIGLNFDYIFDNFSEKGANSSYFKVEAWNGSSWSVLLTIQEGACEWFKLWDENCVEEVTLDVSQYKNDHFKLRWSYSDGGDSKWTGTAAIDNIRVTANRKVNIPCGYEEFNITDDSVMQDSLQANKIYLSTTVSRPAISLHASSLVELNPGTTVASGSSMEIKISPCDD